LGSRLSASRLPTFILEFCPIERHYGLMVSTPHRAVLVRALVGVFVLCSFLRRFSFTVPLFVLPKVSISSSEV